MKSNRTFLAVPQNVREWSKFLEGLFWRRSFTATLTGLTTTETGIVYYSIAAGIVCLFIPTISGTSNSTGCTITGLPDEVCPEREDQDCVGRGTDNGTDGIVIYRPKTSNLIQLYSGADAGAFTGSGTKGTLGCSIVYQLE